MPWRYDIYTVSNLHGCCPPVPWPLWVPSLYVSKGSCHPVGGEAGVVPLWPSVRVIAPPALQHKGGQGMLLLCLPSTHHLPLEVTALVIGKVTQTRVKGAVTFALVPGAELDFVNSYVAAVPPGLR